MTAYTTLRDYGRRSEKYGKIPFHNVYNYRFYVTGHNIPPHDVWTWCKECCEGLYRIDTYTHASSVRDNTTGKWVNRVRYVDKVYIERDCDAVTLRLTFDVSEVTVMRSEKFKRD